MQHPTPRLTSDAESLLVALLHESNHNPHATTSRLTSRSGLAGAAAAKALQELVQSALVVEFDSADGTVVALTNAGREVAADLGVPPAQGALGEVRAGLDSVQDAILNAVVEHELRVAGGAATRSHIRTRVRTTLSPKPDTDSVNGYIDGLVNSYLHPLGGNEPSYQATLRGLLASAWGANALELVGRTMAFLRARKEEEPSLFRYSWKALRQTVGLPMKALNLAYLTIGQAQLGRGLFSSEGDYWWSVPPDIDVLLEDGSAIDFIRALLREKDTTTQATEHVERTYKPAEAPELADTVLARVSALLEPNENPTVRLQEAFQRLNLHPAIASASTKMFRDGHYRGAVLDACIALVSYVRDKSGRRDLDGSSLMQHVFSPENPRLAFNPRRTQSQRDEQQGLMQLFVGAMQALRNPRAHDLAQDSPEEALECILLLSLLARRVDRAKRTRAARKSSRKKPA